MFFPRLSINPLLTAIGVCLCLIPGWVIAEEEPEGEQPGFYVLFSETEMVEKVVRLDAGFDLKLSPELIEAISKGVPITINIEMEVLRKRGFWLDDEVARVTQRYTITYNDLTRSYGLDNLNSGTHFNLPTLDSTLWVISALSDFPFLDTSLLDPEASYYYRIRLGVDVESLPVPLRAMAYLFSSWHLTSDWYTWPLNP